jgi:hypothetical protein
MNPTRPGYRTTEFWLTLFTALLSCLVATGVVAPDDRLVLERAMNEIVVKTVAIIANAVVIFQYIASRVALKKGDRT